MTRIPATLCGCNIGRSTQIREGRDSEIAPTEDRPEHQVRITGQLNGSGSLLQHLTRIPATLCGCNIGRSTQIREGRDSEIAPTEDRPEHQVRITGQLNGSGNIAGSFIVKYILTIQDTSANINIKVNLKPTLRTSDFRFSVFISQTCVVPTLSKQFQVNRKKDKWKIES